MRHHGVCLSVKPRITSNTYKSEPTIDGASQANGGGDFVGCNAAYTRLIYKFISMQSLKGWAYNKPPVLYRGFVVRHAARGN